jgi:hypothetical protein
VALQPFVGPSPLLQFRDIFRQPVGLLGRGISPSQSRYLHAEQHKHRINAYTHQTSMPWVGFEPTIPAFERAKTIHASDRAATVIGSVRRLVSVENLHSDIRLHPEAPMQYRALCVVDWVTLFILARLWDSVCGLSHALCFENIMRVCDGLVTLFILTRLWESAWGTESRSKPSYFHCSSSNTRVLPISYRLKSLSLFNRA